MLRLDDQGGPQPHPPSGWQGDPKPNEPKKEEPQDDKKEDKQ